MEPAAAVPSGAAHNFARGQVHRLRAARAACAAAAGLAAALTSAPRISPRGFRRVRVASSRSVCRRPCAAPGALACVSLSSSSGVSRGCGAHVGVLSLSLAAVFARAALLRRSRLLVGALVACAVGSVWSRCRCRGAALGLGCCGCVARPLIPRPFFLGSKNLGLFPEWERFPDRFSSQPRVEPNNSVKDIRNQDVG